MALTWEAINKSIDDNGPELLRRLSPVLDSMILSKLVQEGVLLNWQKLELLEKSSSLDRATKFLELLKSGSVDNFKKFCSIMRKNNQSAVADMLMPTGQIPPSTPAVPTGQIPPSTPAEAASASYSHQQPQTPAHAELPEDLDEFFRNNLSVFTKMLNMDANFIMKLFEKKVITSSMQEGYGAGNKTNTEKVSDLLTAHLPKRGSRSKVMFLKCILLAEQDDILVEIGLSPAQIQYIKNYN